MITREAWYREALVEEQLRFLVKAFQKNPEWATFESVLRMSERLGQEIPYEVFQMGADWNDIAESLKKWVLAHEADTSPTTLAAFWMAQDVDRFSQGWWRDELPVWIIERTPPEHLPTISVGAFRLFADVNDEYASYDSLTGVFEAGYLNLVTGEYTPYLSHTLQETGGGGGIWQSEEGDIPSSYEERSFGMDLRSLLEELRKGYRFEGGAWEKEITPTSLYFTEKYPTVEGYEFIQIFLSQERDWQIRDAVIEKWVKAGV